MTAITITDLNNAKSDVDHIADVATSTSPTAADRFGGVKKTMSGASADVVAKIALVEAAKNTALSDMNADVAEVEARKILALSTDIPTAIATVAAVNNRGAWVTATAYTYKDIVSNSSTWYMCVVPHTSGATFAEDPTKWRVYQGVTSGDLAAPGGASTVGFQQAGVGVGLSTVEAELRKLSIKVWQYGAVGDGATDDLLALTRADAMCPVGGTLEFEPLKTYRTSARFSALNASTIIGNGATIKPDAAQIAAGGTGIAVGKRLSNYTSFTPFSSVANSKAVTLPAGLSAGVGDVLLFRSSDIRVADGIANYLHGQWCIVESVAGQSITISTPFYAAFTINSIEVWRGSPKMLVTGLDFDLSNATAATTYFEAMNLTGSNMVVDQCRLMGNRYAGVGIHFAGENAEVKNCFIKGFLNVQGLPLPGRVGYGVLAEANNTHVHHNVLTNNKHAVSGGGRYWVNYNQVVENNFISEDIANGVADGYNGSIDVHCNAIGRFIVQNNFVIGYSQLVLFRNKSALITGNTLIQLGAAGSAITGNEQGFDDVVIKDNFISLFASNSNVFGGNTYNTLLNEYRNVLMRGNNVTGGRLFSSTAAGVTFENVLIVDNSLKSGDYLCSIAGAGISVDGLTIQGNKVKSSLGLVIVASATANVLRNIKLVSNEFLASASATYSNAVQLSGATAGSKATIFNNLEIRGNTVDHSANTSTAWTLGLYDATFLNLRVSGNTLTRGANQPTRGITLVRADFIDFQLMDNTLDADINAASAASASSSLTRFNMRGNTLGAFNQGEDGTDFTFIDCVFSGNNFFSFSLDCRAGSTAWANSNEVLFYGNRTRKTAGASVTLGTQTVGNKFRGYGNTLGNHVADNSLTYYAVPVGNAILAASPQPWKGSTEVTQAGEVVRNSSAPTTGAWVLRDRVINKTPTVGLPKAWVCTVAGTPGTWVSEGTL